MVDETGQVSPEMMKQTLDLLHFIERLGKETKEMAVTFLWPRAPTNSIWNTETPTVRPMSSAWYARNPFHLDGRWIWQTILSWQRCWTNLTATSASFLSLSIRPMSRREYGHSFEREMGFLAGTWLPSHQRLWTNYRLRKRRKCLPYRKRY